MRESKKTMTQSKDNGIVISRDLAKDILATYQQKSLVRRLFTTGFWSMVFGLWACAAGRRAEVHSIFQVEHNLANWLHLRFYWHPRELQRAYRTLLDQYKNGVP